MAKAIIMPRQGQSVESCIIGEWHVEKGQQVKEGDTLFTYETDKATFDEMAPVAGEIIAVFFAEGDDVPCLLNVCVIGESGEDWQDFIPEGATVDGAGQAAGTSSEAEEDSTEVKEKVVTEPEKEEPQVTSVSETPTEAQDLTDLKISPRARELAFKKHVDLRFVKATGPEGRIIERDVEAAIQAGHIATAAAGTDFAAGIQGTGIGGRVRVEDLKQIPQVAEQLVAAVKPVKEDVGEEYYDKKLPNIRKVISRSMHASISQMAQLTLHTSFDATDMLNLRARLKKAKEQGLDEVLGLGILERVPTINDIILYAVTRVIKRHPDCNAHFLEDTMRYYNRVHLGVAVDTPRGLMVPVVKNGDLKSISEISQEARSLAEQCQSGTINPDYLSGSTITITNLGTLGIEYFTPINNPPETCILGVGGLTTAVREVDGEISTYKSMTLSLTIDHRAVDGAPGARFLKDLKFALENFSLLLMD